MSRASVRIGLPPREGQPLALPELSRPREPGRAPAHEWREGAFCYTVRDDLPARAWQLPLSNGRLSAIACDCGPGALWMENARLCRLIPPMDPRRTRGEENLWLRLGDRAVSLFAANDGFPCRVRYEPGLAIWEKQLPLGTVSTEMWIPTGEDFRPPPHPGAKGPAPVWPCGRGCRMRTAPGCAVGWRMVCSGRKTRTALGRSFTSWPEAGASSWAGRISGPPPCAWSWRRRRRPCWSAAAGPSGSCGGCVRPRAPVQETTQTRWREKCFRLRLETGSPALDHYLNGWAVYQTLCCRLWGRGSLYQSGGAYGFRDQLQDAVNLLPVDPGLARERILDACRHQYAQGDVMHWWHPLPDGDRGIRSRCGDDLLWLPWALAEYVHATGDESLCFREEPGLHSPPLKPEERDRYETAEAGPQNSAGPRGERAAAGREPGDRPHGLPFFGSGDWNDGLDAVDGESLWLGWFLAHTARRFAARWTAWDSPARAAGGLWPGRWRRPARAAGTAAGTIGATGPTGKPWAVGSASTLWRKAGRRSAPTPTEGGCAWLWRRSANAWRTRKSAW